MSGGSIHFTSLSPERCARFSPPGCFKHLQVAVNGPTLWANRHLLCWLSFVSFASAWMGENRFVTWLVALYGSVPLLAATAYFILTKVLIALHGQGPTLAEPIGGMCKARFLLPKIDMS